MAEVAIIAAIALQSFEKIKEGQITEAQGKFARQIGERNLAAARANQKALNDAAEANAAALRRQAKAETDASEVTERRVARRGKIKKAAQRAIIGKSGVGLAGATLSVLTDTAFQFFLGRNLTLRRGLIRSRELRQAAAFEIFKGKVLGRQELFRGQLSLAQGQFAFTLGKEAKRLSYIKAGASILGSFTPTPTTNTTFNTQPNRTGSFAFSSTASGGNFPSSSFTTPSPTIRGVGTIPRR